MVVVNSPIFHAKRHAFLLKANRHFEGTFRFLLQGRTMNQESNQHEAGISQGRNKHETGNKQSSPCYNSSVTSVDFQRTTWRFIPEDRTLVI
jgi:hypothetical protein